MKVVGRVAKMGEKPADVKVAMTVVGRVVETVAMTVVGRVAKMGAKTADAKVAMTVVDLAVRWAATKDDTTV
jgi:ACT domain-containing protein